MTRIKPPVPAPRYRAGMLKWGFPQISPITKITVKSPNKVYPNSVYTGTS